MMKLQPVIGIEIHIELKTKTKMFSNSPVTFASIPNSQVNEIDLGYPGSLPSINKQAVVLAIRACQALNMKINPVLSFDRKNYFYPDLPKGYQITQQNNPIGSNGKLTIATNNMQQDILVTRLHLEEDTAKQIHLDNITLLDYNRAGIGLIEIVSEPVIYDVETAINYIETLRKTLLHLGVSNAKMSEGSFRCDINISLRPIESKDFFKRVEVKNLNSLNNVKRAIEFEIKRQTNLINQGTPLKSNETRRFDEKTKTTILMRSKESTVDYKYFPEPNIVPISLEQHWIEEIINTSPESYPQKQIRYVETYGLHINEVNVLLQDIELTNFFEKTIEHTKYYRLVLNMLIGDISAYLKQKDAFLLDTQLTPINLAQIVDILQRKEISQRQAKTLLLHLLENNVSVEQSIKQLNLQQINDEKIIRSLIKPFILENLQILKDYPSRPERVLKFYMGHLMKVTKGQVNPEIGQKIIEEIISENISK
ncbi:Asp-tRNA(Asn)/Glu-tRNA(Gln) amidotransferase subunit GatB [Spiroplasma endosymbiont of Lonchoptera lutea]|uniref:Asp-tRNA(Asn)/Glu-tRNA(Gln) amidotransferase subunit GatB n=1 Tax=Spiroplasma endosymbiont of Lonchoptera lutea TaxID=3066297 RepID=UPI003BAE4470